MSDEQTTGTGGAGWKTLAHRLGLGAERAFESVRDRFDARFRPDRPLHVVPFRGHADAVRATLSARVLVYTAPPQADPGSLWSNLQASYRRFETDEVPDARVRLAAPGIELEGRTDAEGYVHFDFAPPAPPADGGTADFEVALSLPDEPEAPIARTSVTRPGATARFGVISDVDDTVLVTGATSVLRMMRLTLLESSESRVAFPGVGAFYRALIDEADGTNPIFYVSSSPWNLYEFLVDFMRLNGLPEGPLLLRDLGIDEDKFGAGTHGGHKLEAIRGVLQRHEGLDFVLIGDSGQHDPEIYRSVVAEFPGRVRAIYIRDVAGDFRDAEVTALVEELGAAGTPMLLVPDTLGAARHAATLDLIDAGRARPDRGGRGRRSRAARGAGRSARLIDPHSTGALRGEVTDARDAFAARWLEIAREADDAGSPTRASGAVVRGGEAAAVRAALGRRGHRGGRAARDAAPVTRPDPADISDAVIVPGVLGDTVRALVAPLASAAEPLAPHGIRTIVARVNGRTGCAANAAALRPIVLEAAAREGRAVNVVGYSKGCTDALHMLAMFPDTHAAVHSLTSLAGVVHGTPLATRTPGWIEAALRWVPLPGVPFGDGRAVDDLEPGHRATHLAAHPLPDGIRYASVAAATSFANVSRVLRGSWRRLAAIDIANDSQVIDADAVLPAGELLAVVDADHWALALPITERLPIASPLVDRNDFPRVTLLRALLEHVTVDAAPADAGSPV